MNNTTEDLSAKLQDSTELSDLSEQKRNWLDAKIVNTDQKSMANMRMDLVLNFQTTNVHANVRMDITVGCQRMIGIVVMAKGKNDD